MYRLGPRELLEMPGTVLNAYVERIDQTEAKQILMMAQAVQLGTAGDSQAWARAIDRSLPPPDDDETFFRYEGKPVRLPELVASLSDRWGDRFAWEDEAEE